MRPTLGSQDQAGRILGSVIAINVISPFYSRAVPSASGLTCYGALARRFGDSGTARLLMSSE
jgi:hypothetical protein